MASVIGATIVLLLVVVQNVGEAFALTRTLLWPGLRLAQATGQVAHDIGTVLAVVGDVIVYWFVSFLVLRVLRTMLN